LSELADIYALGRERRPEAIARFVEHFRISPMDSAEGYAVPRFSEAPRTVFERADELIAYCCESPTEAYSLYSSRATDGGRAMIFFLEDGGLIYGLSTPAENPSRVDALASELERFLETEEVIVTYETLPPDSVDAFRRLLASLPRVGDAASAQAARGSAAHRVIKIEPGEPPDRQRAERRSSWWSWWGRRR
jgi:hypothetical protein